MYRTDGAVGLLIKKKDLGGSDSWPRQLMMARHATSLFNLMTRQKEEDGLYRRFASCYCADPESLETKELAQELAGKYFLGPETEIPIDQTARDEAVATGQGLWSAGFGLPDVIVVSSCVRTRQTLDGLVEGWPELGAVEVLVEEAIAHQDYGALLSINDRQIFFALHPQERKKFEMEGRNYRFPGGESRVEAEGRIIAWWGRAKERFAGKKLMIIGHHISVIVSRRYLEGLSQEEFFRIEQESRPSNCGITFYTQSGSGLSLEFYDKKFL